MSYLIDTNMHADFINSVVFSKDGSWILTASDDRSVKLYRCETCGATVPHGLLQARLAAARAAALDATVAAPARR